MFFITSLIPIQTKLYHTERSLSESWRSRSKTRNGFDVASVTASTALGKLQSDNTPEIKSKYVELLRQYKYVFSWSYDELRTYDTTIMEHKIPLKQGVKPFRHKIR